MLRVLGSRAEAPRPLPVTSSSDHDKPEHSTFLVPEQAECCGLSAV